MKFTKQQEKVITTRNKNILVSAAAGSGKTSVLVERILSMITDKDNPVDIDRFLIVTFTNAAAAEMRGRIHARILQGLEENPSDENLQRQSALIHNAQITTIDSYCLFLLRNHFHEIGLDPAFRVGDPGEMKLIEKDVLEQTLESFYEEAEEEFLFFVDAYCPDGKDGAVEGLVEGLYKFSMSHPWPQQWLSECENKIDALDESNIIQTEWMQFGMSLAAEKTAAAIPLAKAARKICTETDGPHTYLDNIESDIEILEALAEKVKNCTDAASYEEVALKIQKPGWTTLSRKKDETVCEEKKEMVKNMRDRYKNLITEVATETFAEANVKEIVEKEKEAGRLEKVLLRVTQKYIENLAEAKKEKNVLDFSDMEHFALNILVKDGKPTKTAEVYRDYYKAVMIDEYQDSNMVQELILDAVAKKESGEKNRFMVGDMKQSIYRFRMARPEIFMEKYKTYTDEGQDDCLICLKQNFRSRKEVLDTTNDIFGQIMIPQVGGVVYDDEAALYLGADYAEAEGCETELCLAVAEGAKSEERREIEAYMIADKIRHLMAEYKVEGRPLQYRDIVILLRSGSGVDEKLKEILISEGIPAYVTLKSGYFSALEISQIMDLLRVMNNPYTDVPFCSVATSMFFGMTNEELARITAATERELSLYERFMSVADGSSEQLPEEITEKVKEMLTVLKELREEAVVCSMTELVDYILRRFHYMEYVSALPAGQQRKANVEMFVQKTVDFEQTSYHGLFRFLRYMEQLKQYEVDFGEASTLTETADVVRIMTIHKSKGLEFPVCFVAGLDKKYNLKDTTDTILLDADWGVVANRVKPASRTTGQTMRKKAFMRKMKRDSIGEELRVLYVAMTRAKEKLILTGSLGSDPDFEKLRAEMDAICGGAQKTLSADYVERCQSALEHIAGAYVRKPECLKYTPVCEEEIERKQIKTLSGKIIREERVRMLSDMETEELNQEEIDGIKALEEKFTYRYPQEILSSLYTKTSVSELKHAAIEEQEIPVMFETEDKEKEYLPAFMRGEEVVNAGATRGSAVHRVLELLDFSKYVKMDKVQMSAYLKEDMERMVAEGRMSEEYKNLIFGGKIVEFLSSNLAERMALAQEKNCLFKEQPFIMAVSASLLKEEYPETEKVLIQGIVDVYFEEEDGLVIVDYKTDRVNSSEQLKERYKTQLDYYEEAIERLTGKKVKEKILYSFALAETVSWK